MTLSRRHERGQILPIAAVAFMVLIGIAGLVIDVGMTWILLRREQAAVDVASIAAARFIPDDDVAAMEQAACFYARQNDFFSGATTNDLSPNGCVPANDTFGSVLTVNYPPASGDYAGVAGYVEVILNGSHQTFFSRVFGVNTMAASADAISGNVETSGGGGQLVALDPTSCGAGMIRGNGTVDVEGSVYVNSDGSTANATAGLAACPATGPTLNDTCEGSAGAFMFGGSNAILDTPLISVRGICGKNANPFPTYCSDTCQMVEGAPQIEDPFNLVTPTIAWASGQSTAAATKANPSGGPAFSLANCDGPSDTDGCNFGGGGGANCGAWCELDPGVYYSGWTISTTVCLNPGFYYLAGGGIQVTGQGRIVTLDAGEDCATVATSPTLGGDGRILLYSTDGPSCPSTGTATRQCQGVISIEGQGGFQARGYEETSTVVRSGVTDDGYHRVLVWQAQYKEDGVTPTRLTYPGETDFANDKIRIAGQGYLNFWGTIYAPKSLVEIQGQGSGIPGHPDTAGVQILAWRFDIGGEGNLDMPFDPNELSTIIAKGIVQ